MTDNDTMMAAAWGVTFDGEAKSAFVRVAEAIPTGYTVALLAPGQGLPEETGGVITGADVSFVKADVDGVTFRYLDSEHSEATGPEHLRPWDQIGRIHIY